MSSKTEEDTIEKLMSSKNFHVWKFELQIYLKASSLEDVVVKTSGNVDALKDAKAQKLIICSIDKKLKAHILGCKTAAEMYKKLCSIFEGNEERNKCSLLQEFFNFQYKNQTMTQLITEVENLAMRLNSLGQKVDDELIMSKLLTCLPTSYKFFVTAWESTPQENKTLINLTNRLLMEECRNEKTEEPVAYKTSQSKKCFKCGKTGHIKTDCKMCNICKKYNHDESKCRMKSNENQCSICKKDNHKEENCFFRKNKTKSNKETAFLTRKNKNKTEFVVDSGSTVHMTNDINLMTDFEENKTEIAVADNNTMISEGFGNVKGTSCKLEKTLFVPELAQNLISVSAITDKQGSVLFTGNKVEIYKNKELVIEGVKENGLYYIDINKNKNDEISLLTKEKGTALEWHRRLGHPSREILKTLTKVANGIKIDGNDKIEETCEICIKAKQTKLPHNTIRKRGERILEIINTDVCGPFETETHDGKRYFVTMIDDHSHFTKVYLVRQKSDVPEIIKNYIQETEREKNEKVSCIRCDNGGEYANNDLKNWCIKKGIRMDFTVPYTPQLNGRSERFNRTILEKTRAMLFNKNMENEMWGEAVLSAVYIINRLPSDALQKRTPYEIWNGRCPDISNIQEFGTYMYSKHLGHLKKLQPRSKKLIMVGYTNNGYRLWNPEQRKIEIARDVVIVKNDDDKIENDEERVRITTDETVINEQEDNEIIPEDNEIIPEDSEEDEMYFSQEEQESTDTGRDELRESPVDDLVVQQEIEEPRTSKRVRKLPVRFNDYALLTYNDAISGTEKDNWKKAIDSEKESLLANNTWEVVDVQEARGKKILSNKWVFRIKDDGTYKARLVVRGFEQHGLEMDEIYSPVVSQSALKSLFALAAHNNSEIMIFDVKTAFLYGELSDKNIYMNIPEGYKKESNKVIKLNKALYGLKQAPITWNKTFTNVMLKLGLVPTKTDRCVFTNNNKTIIIAIYVDDGLAIAKDKQTLINILKCLRESFEIKIYENPENYIGLEISKDTEGITLTQKVYTEMLLNKFNMNECKSCRVPGNTEKKTETDMMLDTEFPYRELVGGLLYLSTRTRPDIAHAVHEASKKIEKPDRLDVIAVKKILRYLAGTKDKGISFKKGCNDFMLNAYCDADYANDTVTRRSTSGYVLLLSDGPISWCSRRQPIVALSSTEAEFIAAAECCKEILYVKSLLNELISGKINIIMNIDNQSAIQLIKTGSFNKRSKHIDVRYHFIHEQFVKGNINVKYCSTDQQVADILTKPLLKNKFELHCEKLMNK